MLTEEVVGFLAGMGVGFLVGDGGVGQALVLAEVVFDTIF